MQVGFALYKLSKYRFGILLDFESKDCYVWIALRPNEVEPGKRYERYETEALAYKEQMLKNGFHIPVLTHNMRNSSNVISGLESLQTSGRQFKALDFKGNVVATQRKVKDKMMLTVPKAPLPPNTVPGNLPIIVPTTFENYFSVTDLLTKVIEKHFVDPSEQVVVLIINFKRMKEVLKGVLEGKMMMEKRNLTTYCPRSDSFDRNN